MIDTTPIIEHLSQSKDELQKTLIEQKNAIIISLQQGMKHRTTTKVGCDMYALLAKDNINESQMKELMTIYNEIVKVSPPVSSDDPENVKLKETFKEQINAIKISLKQAIEYEIMSKNDYFIYAFLINGKDDEGLMKAKAFINARIDTLAIKRLNKRMDNQIDAMSERGPYVVVGYKNVAYGPPEYKPKSNIPVSIDAK